MTIEETLSAQKYKIYIFYGVIICDKNYSIVNK